MAWAAHSELRILDWGGIYRAEAGGALLRSVSAGSLSYAGRPQRAGCPAASRMRETKKG
jgi:hypothetical protein